MIADNLAKANRRIGHSNATLIAVSKTRSVSELQQAIDCGQRHFGENYLQEALKKIQVLQGQPLIWHFIGPIQSNKTAKIAKHFDWVHSVDRLKIAERLNAQRQHSMGKLNVLLQVNIDGEPTKSGVSTAEIDSLVAAIQALDNLNLAGFMCIPNPNNAEQSFKKMAQIFKQYPQLDTLSMGMSNDLELAIDYGATFVRVGTGVFGQRSTQA